MGTWVVNFAQECFRLKVMSHNINKTFLILIPKSNQPTYFNHFKPISLCNFVYKVVSKILTERLNCLMGKFILPQQGAFLENRWIAENTVVAQKVVHKVRHHQGRNGLMILKVDMQKAYDRLEWSFIGKALEVWGFLEDARRMILSCVSTVHYSILLNGGITGSFFPSRGLRHGDPLSPYLFILCFEFLTRLLCGEEDKGGIYGIKVSRNAPAISHLMYADNLLVMCRANLEEAGAVKS